MAQYKYKNRKSSKKKFKKRYIVLAVLAVLIVAGGTVTVKNWDNIQAGYTGLTSDPEKIREEQAQKKAELEQGLGLQDGFSDEEMTEASEALRDVLGGGSLEEFLFGDTESVLGNSAGSGNGTGTVSGSAGQSSSGNTGNSEGTASAGSTSTGNGGNSSSNASSSGNGSSSVSEGSSGNEGSSGSNGSSGSSGSNQNSSGSGTSASNGNSSETGTASDADAITRKYTAQLYALESAMKGKMNSMAASVKAEYAALPAEEKTSAKRTQLVSSKLDEAEALESECDAAVDTILSNMESELKAAGGDTSSVAQMRDYYESEKASQKAAAIAAMRSAG